ncbi:DUF6188 family protein [Herbiconiux ginsengi]|uniref:Uncharacterized protein n=1 Tax=Herbiconiux ginsengi TaxID=381665 RepID=A0A1H3S596_9MICO|nr:DUF6188 family protein [Herbiconiux ginsengi]SDZ32755.1 hypothetical protein SAMN05216554_3295 [Herbiconiux ginsengi]
MTDPTSGEVVLSIRGELVTQLRFDFGFTIVTEGSEIRIETPFQLIGLDAETRMIDPEQPSRADELLELHQAYVDGDCFDDGRLELRFSNGFTVNVASDINFEAWALTRGSGEMAVATPGGGVAIFRAGAPSEVDVDE